MMTGCSQQLTLWNLGPQQVTVTFQGGRIVSDAGLLGIRKRSCQISDAGSPTKNRAVHGIFKTGAAARLSV